MSNKNELQLARSVAKAFCTEFNFPADKISELDGPPTIEPTPLNRNGYSIIAYRWLGGGRGDYIVQVEIYQKSNKIIVYGGYGDTEFGPWEFKSN